MEDKKMTNFQSQVGQDEWVVSFFSSKRNGYFLDIGSHNGVDLSNTYYLEKELQWNGICVEADPYLFGDLRKNRGCICVNVAASDSEGKIKFLMDGFSGRAEDTRGSIEVETRSMSKILEDNSAPKIIDYMSLDVEGMEYNVILGAEKIIDSYKPVITFEQHLETDNYNLILDYLTNKNYVVFLIDEILPGCRPDCRNSIAFPKDIFDPSIVTKIHEYIGKEILLPFF